MSKVCVTYLVTDFLEVEDINNETLVNDTVNNSYGHLEDLLKGDYKVIEAEIELVSYAPILLN